MSNMQLESSGQLPAATQTPMLSVSLAGAAGIQASDVIQARLNLRDALIRGEVPEYSHLRFVLSSFGSLLLRAEYADGKPVKAGSFSLEYSFGSLNMLLSAADPDFMKGFLNALTDMAKENVAQLKSNELQRKQVVQWVDKLQWPFGRLWNLKQSLKNMEDGIMPLFYFLS